MCNAVGSIKRLVPFIAAIFLGVMITSIFVDISSPFERMRERRMQGWHDYQQLKIENDRLRRENEELRNRFGSYDGPRRGLMVDRGTGQIDPVPAPDLDAPPPPAPIKVVPRSR